MPEYEALKINRESYEFYASVYKDLHPISLRILNRLILVRDKNRPAKTTKFYSSEEFHMLFTTAEKFQTTRFITVAPKEL